MIISNQYLNDLSIGARGQIEFYLLFGGLNIKSKIEAKNDTKNKLFEVYKNANLNIPFEEFEQLYLNATSEKYCFLYIDSYNCLFRKCFDELYI